PLTHPLSLHDALPIYQRPTASMPLEINGTVKVSRAVDLRPTVRPAGLFRPDFNKLEFLFQLRIAHDLVPQRSAASCDDLNHRLRSEEHTSELQSPYDL